MTIADGPAFVIAAVALLDFTPPVCDPPFMQSLVGVVESLDDEVRFSAKTKQK